MCVVVVVETLLRTCCTTTRTKEFEHGGKEKAGKVKARSPLVNLQARGESFELEFGVHEYALLK